VHDRLNVAECGGVRAHLCHKHFDRLQNWVGTSSEIVRMTLSARPQAGGTGGRDARKEGHIRPLGFPRLA
jgi:hypothetical protein